MSSLIRHLFNFGWDAEVWAETADAAILLAGQNLWGAELSLPEGRVFRDENGIEYDVLKVSALIELLDLEWFVPESEAERAANEQRRAADRHWAADRASEGLPHQWEDLPGIPFMPLSEQGLKEHNLLH